MPDTTDKGFDGESLLANSTKTLDESSDHTARVSAGAELLRIATRAPPVTALRAQCVLTRFGVTLTGYVGRGR